MITGHDPGMFIGYRSFMEHPPATIPMGDVPLPGLVTRG